MSKDRLVSYAACKGCRHYGFFMPGVHCCNYCYDTGHARPRGELPCECSVKKCGKRANYIQRMIKDGIWPGNENCRIDAAPMPLARRYETGI